MDIERSRRGWERRKDSERLKRAALKSERLSRPVSGWSSVEEIRRWREERSSE